MWAVFGDSTLARLDPSTNRVSGSVLVGAGPTSVVAAFGSVWVSTSGEASVKRFSPVTFTEGQPLDELGVGGSPTGLASGEGAIWVAIPEAGTVSRIDPSSTASTALPIRVGGRPSATATGDGAVWVSNAGDGTVSRIDPATYEVVETIDDRECTVRGRGRRGVGLGRGPGAVAARAYSSRQTPSRGPASAGA